jgi:pimeloyl-ACP methyl ester carboxylesterase
MTDFLIVHDVGQGAWFWNKVWGGVTAPAEHPPRLYTPRYSSQFFILNLPGHGDDEEGDTADVRLDECVQAIARAVERRGMRDLVLVGHGVGAMIAAQAATLLPDPPKRLAMIAGVIPEKDKAPLSRLPGAVRKCFSPTISLNNMLGRDVRLTPSVITKYLCNGMEPREIYRALGYFGPLPTRLMKTEVDLPLSDLPCPVSYVVLDRDRMLSPSIQIAMARLVPNVDIQHLDSCHQAPLHIPSETGELLLALSQ